MNALTQGSTAYLVIGLLVQNFAMTSILSSPIRAMIAFIMTRSIRIVGMMPVTQLTKFAPPAWKTLINADANFTKNSILFRLSCLTKVIWF